jgi:hypothetical protein
MFVKLWDGTLLNAATIQRLERYTAEIPDPSIPYTPSDNMWGWDEDPRPKVKRPALRVVMDEKRNYSTLFESEEERDTEFSRLEETILGSTTLIFPNLAVRLGSVEAVFFTWQRSFMDYDLIATIQLANAAPYVVTVTQDLFPLAQSLTVRFNLVIPEKPKTAAEMLSEQYSKDNSDLPFSTPNQRNQ